jgi:hypothetical protein
VIPSASAIGDAAGPKPAPSLPARSAESWGHARRDPDLHQCIYIPARSFTPKPAITTGVILKDDGLVTEIGSIGIQQASAGTEQWVWAIDNVIAMRDIDTQGRGKDRKDCMKQFRAAWDRFSADPVWLTEFFQAKRKRL